MFTYSVWENICSHISKSKNTIIASDITKQKDNAWLVIKHDVETDVKKALDIANIEAKYGI